MHNSREECGLEPGCSTSSNNTTQYENLRPPGILRYSRNNHNDRANGGSYSSRPDLPARYNYEKDFLAPTSTTARSDPEMTRLNNKDFPMTLLKPLPSSPIFFYFCGKCHVATLTKIISLIYLAVYGFLITLLLFVGHATSVMFAALFFGSVAYSTIYGAFKGSKLCLIPFLFLQGILIFYALLLLVMCVYAVFYHESYLFTLLNEQHIPFNIHPVNVFIAFISFLLVLIGPLVISAHIVYLDYVFISELDEVLDMVKELNEVMSKDDPSPPHF
ncbi:unnamed protein product, partial [Mesorhabditis belari]|uniref:Uncharacterized protein n=1 Tax=Mesorhabditis belari TaxID=2138241 RepID=A0AAF3FLC7_9BILA